MPKLMFPPLQVVDPNGPINYLTAATYTPNGALQSLSNGSSVSGALTYNSRLQPLQMYFTTGTISSQTLTQLQQSACPTTVATIMSRSYNFGLGTNDNGNPQVITNCRDTNRTQNFTYDSLNRIASGYTTGPNWGEDFTIDPWGNLTNRGPHAGKTNYEPLNAAPATNNRLTGFGYDAAGNMTSNGSTTYTYDAENRLTSTSGATYTYDGHGDRVKKVSGSATTLYWFGSSDEVLTETNGSGSLNSDYILFGGKRIARRDANGNVRYYFADHLGSASVVTLPTGAIQSESDYYPYGGEIVITAGSGTPNRYKFTGKERDSESGLDNFGARYHASSLGRFMTPDWSERATAVPYAMFGDPQSLNLYTYVRNDPVARVDADGHATIDSYGDPGPGSDPFDVFSNVQRSARASADNSKPAVPKVSAAQKKADKKGKKQRGLTIKILGHGGKRRSVGLRVGSKVIVMKSDPSRVNPEANGPAEAVTTYKVNNVGANSLEPETNPTEVRMTEDATSGSNCSSGCTNKDEPGNYQAAQFVDHNSVQFGHSRELRQQYFIGASTAPATLLREIPGTDVYEIGTKTHIIETYSSVVIKLE